MRCISPVSIEYPRLSKHFIAVPCGKCIACQQNRRAMWSFRLEQELKVAQSAHFLTLTYDDLHLPRSDTGFPCVLTRDVQLFLKRLRKLITPAKIRYFLVSEYGSETHRPHYHVIMFNFPKDKDLNTYLSKSWTLGHFSVGTVTSASIAYVTKYCLKDISSPDDYEPNFMLCSRKPAIGSNYLTPEILQYFKSHDPFVVKQGYRLSLPKYYKDRVEQNTFRKVQLSQLYFEKAKQIDEKIREMYSDKPCPITYYNEQFVESSLRKEAQKKSKL